MLAKYFDGCRGDSNPWYLNILYDILEKTKKEKH